MKKKTTKSTTFNVKQYERSGLTEDEILEIKEAFDLFDTDKSGQIDTNELKNALNQLGIEAKNQTLQSILADIDKNGDEKIDFDEFIDMMTAKISDKDTEEDLEKVFNLFVGESGSDKIEISDLKRICRELNENISDEELNEMIVRADLDKDGAVSFEDFYAIITGKKPSSHKQEIKILKAERTVLANEQENFDEEEEIPEEIKVKVGSEFEILISGNASTPVHWFFVHPCPKGISPVNIKNDGSAGYKSRDNPSGRLGVGGNFIFKFRADKKGEYTLNFELSRFHTDVYDNMSKKIIVY